MKLLIIGAKGNLGGQLQKVFAHYDVSAWDRDEIDITESGQVIFKIKQLKPDIIINAAAYNAVDKCEADADEFELAKKINGLAVGYLADAALEVNAIFVHYSTDFVFGGENKAGFAESDSPAPINNYGRSKLLGEEEILKRSELGLRYFIIRTSKLFGARGKSEAAKPSFFDIMLKLSREKDELDVVDDELSCFTYTCDLANETRKMIDSKKESGIYHIANSEPSTWYEAAKILFELSGINIKINPVNSDKFPRPAKRPANSVLLNTKLPQLRSYREALREYLNIVGD